MDPLLIYIREYHLELLSIDSNRRVVPVYFQSSNKVPLYFILNGDQIQMDDNAKQQYLNSTNHSFGEFWKNTGNKSLTYTRFQKSFSFDTLLPYAMKETVLPEVIKSYFHSNNFSEFIQQKRTFLLFDSFVEEDQREIITKGFLEIIGFAPNNLTILDFWELFRSFQKTNEDAILFVNASLGNIYIHLIASKYPFHVSKKVIVGKGRDPRVDTILDFVIEKAIARGSGIAVSDLKNIIASEASIILNKLPNGFVQHTIRNNKLDVNPLRLDFNAQEVESRLSNKQSINFIQNEFEEFMRNNNASQLCIYLNGSVITQPVFSEFFKSTYNKVKVDNLDTSKQFLEDVLGKCKSGDGVKDFSSSAKQIDTKVSHEHLIQFENEEKEVSSSSNEAPVILYNNEEKKSQPSLVSLSPKFLVPNEVKISPLEPVEKQPPLPKPKVGAPLMPTGLKPSVSPTRVVPPPVPSGLKPPPLPATKVSAPPLPPGVKQQPIPPTKVSAPPVPPGVKRPPVPPTKGGSPPVPPGVKPPPPPPPPPKNKK